MASALIDYLEALNRLVAKGIKPTLDGVASEAGRQKGSIRRSLDRHKEIVNAIEHASAQFQKDSQMSVEHQQANRINKLSKERDLYKNWYDNLLSKHIGVIYQLEENRIEILELREKLGKKITKIKAEGNLVNIVK